jgi:signal transduction histidine kinase
MLLADNFINREVITDEDVERLRAFANHASLAIENSNLYKTLEEKLQELSSAYHELQANRDKLIRYERLSAVGELAAKVTHEIRNPMVAIGGFARRLLKKDLEGEELNRNYLRIIIEEISNLENILTDILYFAKPAEPKCDLADCNAIIANILEVLAVELEENKISVECRPAAALPLICIDQNQIRRVIINIIRNAIQAMPDGGHITITTRREDPWLTVEIADTGVGVADGHIDKLFDAFFSSKSTGSGLGLTVSAQIINNHGGTIEVMRGAPKGTVFVVKLPLVSPLQAQNT